MVPASNSAQSVPLEIVTTENFGDGLSETERNWAEENDFCGEAGTLCALPNAEGRTDRILVGVGEAMPQENDPWWLASVAAKIPSGTYLLKGVSDKHSENGAIGWCLEQYRFDTYLSEKPTGARALVLSSEDAIASVTNDIEGIKLTRDLINTPTEHMGPADLQDAAEALAEAYGGTCSTIVGEDLLDENFPAIHTVGRAAGIGRDPRLIDLNWGDADAPKLTLVGKGVCFDTGGLDIKPSSGMRLMKKDMGGAAHVLGLARMIMGYGLKVKLRVLIPAVENAISADAYRPGDIIATRKGLSVEIGNTDAEGRLVLCDALTLASEEKPDLLLDFATLTGAARAALGPDLPATFANEDALWNSLNSAGTAQHDPLWRMPLWAPYDESLASPIADLNNISDAPLGGAITAALYLQRFVGKDIPWAHFDVFGWAPRPLPGRPKGAAAQGLRASLKAITEIMSL
ncbi:MAG: leucyl aminopeptidase family protein [Kordiimonadaceae bacterium]|nr:leucyl aminopeptidase family protein [Kordiimonadaceae bacterium]